MSDDDSKDYSDAEEDTDISDHAEEAESDSDEVKMETEEAGDNESNNGAEVDKSSGAESKEDKLKAEIRKRYDTNKGKKLYIRFPKKLPSDDEEFHKQALALSPLIVKAHKPRQKHARFCLVEFASQADRDKAFAEMSKDSASKRVLVRIPRLDDEKFVSKITEKKLKNLMNKRAKLRLKRASKVASAEKNFTSSVVVGNLPDNTTMVELHALFPGAVDIQMRKNQYKRDGGGGVAVITLATPKDARNAVKENLSVGGVLLKVRFDKSTVQPKDKVSEGTEKITIQKEKTNVKNLQVKKSQKTVKESPKSVKESPKTVKESPKTVKESPKTVKKSPKTVKESPKSVKESPKTVKESPKTVKKTPKTVNKKKKPAGERKPMPMKAK